MCAYGLRNDDSDPDKLEHTGGQDLIDGNWPGQPNILLDICAVHKGKVCGAKDKRYRGR